MNLENLLKYDQPVQKTFPTLAGCEGTSPGLWEYATMHETVSRLPRQEASSLVVPWKKEMPGNWFFQTKQSQVWSISYLQTEVLENLFMASHSLKWVLSSSHPQTLSTTVHKEETLRIRSERRIWHPCFAFGNHSLCSPAPQGLSLAICGLLENRDRTGV